VTAGALKPAIVLVADRTLSAEYKVLFEGIFATMQTTKVPALAMRHFVSPRVACDDSGRAHAAPLGIRRVEAALIDAGVAGPDDVVCTTPEALHGLLGPWTKIVGVSSSDFLGRGMSNTTTHAFWSGRLYTEFWLAQMMDSLRAAKARHEFSIVAGGAGAWQLAADPQRASELGFDTVFEGYFEDGGPALLASALAGQPLPAHVKTDTTACEGIRPIRGSSVLGVIELSRGCGKGCRFCTTGLRKMEHLPAATILADLKLNAAAGRRSVVSSSEDFFRYGGSGVQVNFEALQRLLESMRAVADLSFMQIDHANVSSVLQLDRPQLREVRRLLRWRAPTEYLWVNMGIESASAALVQANAPGKAAPFDARDWEDMVKQAAARLQECGFYPVLSLILGLPGETSEDVLRTRRLVEYLSRRRAVIFPVFHEPIDAAGRRRGEAFDLTRMTRDHLELYSACYELNFARVPRLYWDNQRAGGVGLVKRLAVQVLGRGEARAWRKNFGRVRQKIAARGSGSAAVVQECKE
jgi:radical SAM superfamily enzyme YgiQ (UPF0313 family)